MENDVLPTEVPRLKRSPVLLRAFEERDAPVVVSASTDPLIPLITTVPTDAEPADVTAYIQRQHDRVRDGQGYSFAIADATTDAAVGQIGLWTRDIDAGRASTGYWIAPEFRRRGYARAALAVLTAWARTVDGVARLQLYIEPRNEASRRTVESCGYHREGVLRSWEAVGSERRDMVVYSLVPGDPSP